MQVACADGAMLSASDRLSFVLAIAIALALGGPGLGAIVRAQAPAPSGGGVPQDSSSSTPDARQPSGGPEAVPYRVPGRALVIPADGALPIESFNGDVPVVEVTDATDTIVPGLLHEVGISDHGLILAWVPTAPLSIGPLRVSLSRPLDTIQAQVVHVRVEAPFPRELPPIDMEVSASLVELPEWRECCQGAPGGPPNGCFTHHESFVRVEPGFTSPVPSAFLSQYLFRIQPALGSGPSSIIETFKPFEQPDALDFYGAAPEYCVQVEARNIATRKTYTYPVIGCTAFGEMGWMIGKQELGDSSKLAYEVCPLPPKGQVERWCRVNPDLCMTEDPQACAIHEYLCNGAPAPAIVNALRTGQYMSSPPRVERDATRDAEPDACSAAPVPRTRASPASLVGLLAVAALALARRRR